MSEYILSVIVPTKNRVTTLSKLVELFELQNLPGVELVIQDNSTTKDADIFFNTHKFGKNISVHRYSETLSFVKNFSIALEHAKGEYVIFVGDDDSVLPNIVDVTKHAIDNDVDCIVGSLDDLYFWPNSLPGDQFKNGKLIYKNKRQQKYKSANIGKELNRFFKNGCINYLDYYLPKIYHGIVKKEKMLEVKKVTGDYFIGLTPDLSSCIGLALVGTKTLFAKFPFTLSGIAKNSGSSASGSSTHQGKLSDAPHLNGHDNYKWNELIPDYYSVETIWAETALATATKFSSFSTDSFNVEPLLYISKTKYFKYFSQCSYYSKHIAKINESKKHIFLRPKFQRLFNKFSKKVVRYGVKDIVDATNIVSGK